MLNPFKPGYNLLTLIGIDNHMAKRTAKRSSVPVLNPGLNKDDIAMPQRLNRFVFFLVITGAIHRDKHLFARVYMPAGVGGLLFDKHINIYLTRCAVWRP